MIIKYYITLSNLSDVDFPRFAEPMPNVTAAVGRDALLACLVDNLQNYKVTS